MNYNESIMPKTVTADTAATERAILLFLSLFFSSFNFEIRSVTFTTLDLSKFSWWKLCFSNFISELIQMVTDHSCKSIKT